MKRQEVYDLFKDKSHHIILEKDYVKAVKEFNNNLDKEFIIIQDVLPRNERYTKPDLCGELYKLALSVKESRQPYIIHAPDFGQLIVRNPQKIAVGDFLYFSDLKNELGVTFSFDEVKQFISRNEVRSLSDEELREKYKELKGTHYRGKFNRETLIEKINELTDYTDSEPSRQTRKQRVYLD